MGALMRRRGAYRLSTTRCRDDGVASAREHSARDFTQRFLVIDNEDRLCARWWAEKLLLFDGLTEASHAATGRRMDIDVPMPSSE